MTNKYNVGRIKINNFKHIDSLILDFSEKNLILLEGPNGYGKTTIFDAIELVVTGKINRIKNMSDGRSGFENMLFVKNEKIDTEIRIEFLNKLKKFTIVKYINSNNTYSKQDRKPENWNIFETHLLNSFNEPISNENIASADEIKKQFNVKDLERYFNLFYYVQQEENTIFLQQSEKERMNSISTLFDTTNEQQKQKRVNESKKIVDKELEKISTLITQKNDELNKIDNEIKSEKKKNDYVEYFRLLTDTGTIAQWDKELKTLSRETRDKYIEELRSISSILVNFDYMLNHQFNNYLQEYSSNNELLRQTVIVGEFIEDFEEIENLKDNRDRLIKLQKGLQKENFSEKLELNYIEEAASILNIKINIISIERLIERLKDLKKEINNFSHNISKLLKYRLEVKSLFESHKEVLSENECPLCGFNYESNLLLLESIREKEKRIKELLRDDFNEFDSVYSELTNSYINPIVKSINEYLSDDNNKVNEEYYSIFKKSYEHKDKIIEFIKWSKQQNLRIQDYFIQSFEDKDNIIQNKENLKEYLKDSTKKVKSNYSSFTEDILIYNNTFQGNPNYVTQLSVSDVTRKANYINQQYYNTQSLERNKVNEHLIALKKEEKKLSIIKEKIKLVHDIYQKQITEHWKKIIKDIEIPFYIYSGKIIQNYQQGLGVFIKVTGTQNNQSIRFVSDASFDQDVTNYFSSGQLSALVLALTLALNKVYGEKSIDLLLIDDPVQTLDEINVASLTELLRNEFAHKQIILSTHENDISRYISYKFLKYNLTTLKLNLKTELHKTL